MPRRKRQSASSTTRKLAELAVATPQVMGHRLTRMAMAGPVLSDRDRKEFTGMVQEKQRAFAQSWMAMAAESVRVQQSLLMSLWSPTHLLKPWSAASVVKSASLVRSAANRVAAKGLAPVHSQAVANAKRLRKTKLK